jgi:hypothetical protein
MGPRHAPVSEVPRSPRSVRSSSVLPTSWSVGLTVPSRAFTLARPIPPVRLPPPQPPAPTGSASKRVPTANGIPAP